MGKLITAIGEGVAQFAGPLGAPLKGLISYQNSERWELLFEELMKARQERTESTEQIIADFTAQLNDNKESNRQIIMLLQSIVEIVSQNSDKIAIFQTPHTAQTAQHLQPADVEDLLINNQAALTKRFTLNEPALNEELLRLVGSQDSLLNAVGLVAPYVRSWISPEMVPETAFRYFIEKLRGRSVQEQQKIFTELAKKYPGSAVFGTFASAYAELIARTPEE